MGRNIDLQDKRITSAQWSVWIITAMLGPVVFCANGDWYGSILAGAVFSFLGWLVCRVGRHWSGPVYCVVQILWLCTVLSQLLLGSAQCWPTAQNPTPIIPITILILACIAGLKGAECAANGIGVLFWVAAGLLATVILSGIGDMELSFIAPERQQPNYDLMRILLLPASAALLKREKSPILPFAATALMAVGVSLWIAGLLSAGIAGNLNWPFYEAAKSVRLLDIARRFEALVSVGVTVGYYALFSLLLCEVGALGSEIGIRKGAVILATVIAGVFTLLGFRLNAAILVVLGVVFWVLMPILGVMKTRKKE